MFAVPNTDSEVYDHISGDLYAKYLDSVETIERGVKLNVLTAGQGYTLTYQALNNIILCQEIRNAASCISEIISIHTENTTGRI